MTGVLSADDLVFFSTPVSHVPLLERLRPVAAAGFGGIAIQPGDVWQLKAQGMARAREKA